jgi:hypothetical protein
MNRALFILIVERVSVGIVDLPLHFWRIGYLTCDSEQLVLKR